jgi:hypothetical protein
VWLVLFNNQSLSYSSSFSNQDFNSITKQAGGWMCCFYIDLANILTSGYGQIYQIILNPIENCKQDEVMIGVFLACNYMDFVSMMTSSLGNHGK